MVFGLVVVIVVSTRRRTAATFVAVVSTVVALAVAHRCSGHVLRGGRDASGRGGLVMATVALAVVVPVAVLGVVPVVVLIAVLVVVPVVVSRGSGRDVRRPAGTRAGSSVFEREHAHADEYQSAERGEAPETSMTDGRMTSHAGVQCLRGRSS